MDEKQTDDELNQWFSTYGVITAERILGKYDISLPQNELIIAIKSPNSFYHQIVQVPLKHVLNGIILQQANDYHVYTQKLFIDYLLSGESSKDAESQGALTRESMENERKQLLVLGEEFTHLEMEHEALIAKSQASFIKITKKWKAEFEEGIKGINTLLKNRKLESKKSVIRQGINHALIHCDLIKTSSSDNQYFFVEKISEIIKIPLNDELKKEILMELQELVSTTLDFNEQIMNYSRQTNEMIEKARSFRTQFYDSIIRVTELIQLLPDYKIDPEQDVINREPLHFDKNIGE